MVVPPHTKYKIPPPTTLQSREKWSFYPSVHIWEGCFPLYWKTVHCLLYSLLWWQVLLGRGFHNAVLDRPKMPRTPGVLCYTLYSFNYALHDCLAYIMGENIHILRCTLHSLRWMNSAIIQSSLVALWLHLVVGFVKVKVEDILLGCSVSEWRRERRKAPCCWWLARRPPGDGDCDDTQRRPAHPWSWYSPCCTQLSQWGTTLWCSP